MVPWGRYHAVVVQLQFVVQLVLGLVMAAPLFEVQLVRRSGAARPQLASRVFPNAICPDLVSPDSAIPMKTNRRSCFAAIASCLAAFFSLPKKPASASSVRYLSDPTDPSAPASSGPKVVVSRDGRTRTYFNARGEVVQTDHFDELGRLVQRVTTERETVQVMSYSYTATRRFGWPL